MSGIHIEIEENSNTNQRESVNSEENYDIPIILNNVMVNETFDGDAYVAKQLDYQENYTMNDLKKIADYYNIQTRKLRKDELIQELVIFESDENNNEVYLRRLQAWYWLKEFKQDAKLKQYILF